jgi:hypothetical protein
VGRSHPASTTAMASAAAEALCGVRAAYGAALVLAPRAALGGRSLGAGDPGAVAFARVLGLRHLAEAAALFHRSDRRLLLAGAAVDGAHGASMLVLAALSPSRRRLAAAGAASAVLFASAGLLAAR